MRLLLRGEYPGTRTSLEKQYPGRREPSPRHATCSPSRQAYRRAAHSGARKGRAMNAVIIVIVVAVILVLIVAGIGWTVMRNKRRTDHLRDRFGPEYDRTLDQIGSKKDAEPVLLEREERVSQYDLQPLSED